MRVLWFTNTPSLAAEVLNDKGNIGGWIASLEAEVGKVDDIELGVAFHYGATDKKQFSIGKTKYYSFPYPILSKGNNKGILSRWKHKIEPTDVVNYYLEVVNQFKPDIIHIFGTENAFGLLIDKVNVPVVIQIQGNLSVYEKKWFSGVSNFNIFRYSSLSSLVQAYGIWHLFFLFEKRANREREIMKKCSYMVGRTNWDRRITKVLSPNRKYFHCDELLRSEFYTTKKWSKPNNSKFRLLSILSAMSYKGIETILETADLLKKNNLLDVDWHIVGINGTEEIIQITERAFHLKFADYRIRFLGNQGPEGLIEEFLHADCFIHPSHIENSPNSVCEAMLLGVPIIATYAGGTDSLITNGIEGVMIQDGDPYSLAGAIYELCQDEILMQRMSENAIKKAEKRHNSNKILADLLLIYNTVTSDFAK